MFARTKAEYVEGVCGTKEESEQLMDAVCKKPRVLVHKVDDAQIQTFQPPQDIHASPLPLNTDEGLSSEDVTLQKLLTTVTELEELNFAETTLRSVDARKAMVSRLSLVGGTTLSVRVRRMLRTTLSNELASQLNWAGKIVREEAKQKRAFKDTNLCKIMYDSLKRQIGTDASEYMFAAVVKTWLRYAPDRIGGSGRRNIEAHQTETN
ncbi:uncharacterized protein LOC144020836 isoform X5 [Festucalex cinctus]